LSDGNIIPIVAGARLSGKPSKDWRIGVMGIQTADKTINSVKLFPQNYFVAAAQYNVFKRSNIAAIFVNKEQFDSTGISSANFNRVAGLDYNINSADNKWRGKLFFHHSFSNKNNDNAFAHASWIYYRSYNWSVMWNHEYVDKNYNAETGFTPRIFQRDAYGMLNRFSYWRFEPEVYYINYPGGHILNRMETGIYFDHYRNQKFDNTDWLIRGKHEFYFENSAFIGVYGNAIYTKLFFPTDVSFTGRSETLSAGDYFYQNAEISLMSNARKKFIIGANSNYGTYFTGTKLSYGGILSYRLQPYAIFSLDFTRDEIQLPYLNQMVELNLISPRIEMSFTRSIFLTTFWQYNSQAKNINFNGRLQWRFKPMSDLFIVYSDNYDNLDYSIKNRAIVAKLVLWINT
ncbi:MAG: hypothetical protein AB7O73_12640, partial [Bacteroidia bacterium]